MNIDKLKANWLALSVQESAVESNCKAVADKIAAGKATGMQRKLAAYYKRTVICGLMLPAMAPFLVFSLDLSVFVAVLYGLFGILMAIGNLWLYRYIVSCNFITNTIAQSLRHSLNIGKWRARLFIVGIVLGCAILAVMFAELIGKSSDSVVADAVCGLVIGVAVALVKYRRMRKVYRQMLAELNAAMD